MASKMGILLFRLAMGHCSKAISAHIVELGDDVENGVVA